MNPKLHSFSSVLKLTSRLRRQKKKIVFTNGCFDILHAGHVDYLQAARKAGDYLIVGLNSDRSIRAIKGPTRPINHEADRIKVLTALECVDAVVIFHEETPLNLIRVVQPDVLVKGADWKIKDIAGARDVMGWGGRVKLVRLLPGRSTTSTLKKLKALS